MSTHLLFSGNGSKAVENASPCSSEQFFQHFPKRTTFRSNTENGCYKPITSPTMDQREADKSECSGATNSNI